jgi:hypothetical protein
MTSDATFELHDTGVRTIARRCRRHRGEHRDRFRRRVLPQDLAGEDFFAEFEDRFLVDAPVAQRLRILAQSEQVFNESPEICPDLD